MWEKVWRENEKSRFIGNKINEEVYYSQLHFVHDEKKVKNWRWIEWMKQINDRLDQFETSKYKIASMNDFSLLF